MKRQYIILPFFTNVIAGMLIQMGCKTPEAILNKSGAQLWGEHCVRCHHVPTPNDYKPALWKVIGNHMKLSAGLTDFESNKVVEFLQSSST